jgi:HAE1 family hydrophobic/amphiphilic exporter-1
MTAFTTMFALLPLAISGGSEGGIIGAELATVVMGGLVSSTFLTLIVVPVVYMLMNVSIPGAIESFVSRFRRRETFTRPLPGSQNAGD